MLRAIEATDLSQAQTIEQAISLIIKTYSTDPRGERMILHIKKSGVPPPLFDEVAIRKRRRPVAASLIQDPSASRPRALYKL